MKSIYRLLGASLLLLASCGPFNFSSQEVSCRYNAEDDSLKVRLIYNEVRHVEQSSGWFENNPNNGKPDLERGEKAVRRMLNGDRVFMVAGNLLNYDLDDSDPETQTEFQRGIRVEPAVVELDDKKRLRITQELTFPNFGQGMKAGNQELRKEVAQEVEELLAKPDPERIDQATVELLKADIDANYDWMSWDAKGLHLNFPASPQLLAKLALGGVRHFAATPQDEVKDLPTGFHAFSEMVTSLTELTVQDNRVHLTFGPQEDGWVVFRFLEQWQYQPPEEAEKYDPLLLQHLQELELVSDSNPAKS